MNFKNLTDKQLLDTYEEYDSEKNYHELVHFKCEVNKCNRDVYVRINETDEYLCKRHGAEVVAESVIEDELQDKACQW